MSELTAEYWINKLNLQAHPEGGYFKEVYRSEEDLEHNALPDRYESARSFGTSIYFMLTSSSVSNFHRLSSDEIWHFHYGGRAKIHFIDGQGQYSFKVIGPATDEASNFQVIIPRNTWFAAEVVEGEYILVGCTVAPGFEFEDFELADRELLSTAYPEHKTLIASFTKK